jgi:uncharacterized protein YceH (UPF0502 family)
LPCASCASWAWCARCTAAGERSDKHRHELQQRWGCPLRRSPCWLCCCCAVPQTLAELRARSERLEAFATVDDVERELAVMADRDEPLVGPDAASAGRKEARFEQLLAPPGRPPAPTSRRPQPSRARSSRSGGAAAAPEAALPTAPTPSAGPALDEQVTQLAEEVALLRDEVGRLRALLEQLTG